MSITRSRCAAFVLAVLCLFGSFAATSRAARAATPGVVVGHIEQRIHQARKEVHRWNSTVHAWRSRVHRARVRLRRVLAELSVPRQGAVDFVGAPKAHRSLGPQQLVASALTALHDAIRSRTRDHAVVERRSVRLRLQALRRAKVTILGALEGTGVDPNVRGPLTYERWARALLASLGAPPCASDLQAIVAWQVAESTPAMFNPL